MEIEKESSQKKARSRKLRACLRCKILKTEGEVNICLTKWRNLNSCPNCPLNEHYSYQGNFNHYRDCTSVNFEGMIALINPNQESWVNRYTTKGRYKLLLKGLLCLEFMP